MGSISNSTEYMGNWVCGFEWSFKKLCHLIGGSSNFNTPSNNVITELEAYSIQIKNIIDNTYNSNDPSDKVFPVIFHLILDDPSVIKPSGASEPDFDVLYVLGWVNHWFSGTGISFKGVDIEKDNAIMTTPGLNIIEGSTISQTRYMGARLGNVTQNYVTDGVALDEIKRFDSGPLAKHTYNGGVLFEYIQDNYSWDPTKYINIFLLNRTNSGVGKVVMTSANPYLVDLSGNYNRLSIGVDLWAIGRAYDSTITPSDSYSADVEYTNFGYSYSGTTSENNLTNASSVSEGYRSRAKTIAHSLAHTLGLIHPRNKFNSTDAQNLTADSSCESGNFLFSTLTNFNNFYNDGDADTNAVGNYWQMLDYTTGLETDLCTSETILSLSNNMMNHNQFTGAYESENDVNPTFTQNQIYTMHANSEYTITSFDAGLGVTVSNYGILGQILYNSSTVLTTNNAAEGNTCLERSSFNSPLPLNIKFKQNVSESELSQYNQAKKIITKIVKTLS